METLVRPSKVYTSKLCASCGETFTPRSGFARFCSVQCRRGTATCGHCGGIFVKSDDKRPNKNRYCSTDCRWAWVKAQWSCPKCGDEDRPYETATYCRPCGNELVRQYQIENDRSEYNAAYYQANKDKFADYGNRRRARILANGHEPYSRMDIYDRDGGVCQLCDEPVDLTIPYPELESFTIDHTIPICKGGPDTPENVATAHWGCNKSKFTKVVL